MSSGNKGKFQAKRQGGTDMALQITSMADIFTIILVFLLKGYATSALNVTPSQGLKLPAASTEGQAVQAMTLEISASAIQVENAFVSKLETFKFPAGELQNNGIPTTLDGAIDKQRKRQELIAKANPDVKSDDKVVVVADERTPYFTLKTVLSTAAAHGFTDVKLVVAKKE